ncbi:hypothetical protein GGR56DRAFT_668539 [Xylariaceae sp. FL0804]|nr:hypothetical protein GGR56DRAFT_668539 [Xylariaceae sp. FL0804]
MDASKGGKAGANEHGSPGTHDVFGPGKFMPAFTNLYEQKRSNDPASVSKREALADQKPKGVISKAMER